MIIIISFFSYIKSIKFVGNERLIIWIKFQVVGIIEAKWKYLTMLTNLNFNISYFLAKFQSVPHTLYSVFNLSLNWGERKQLKITKKINKKKIKSPPNESFPS